MGFTIVYTIVDRSITIEVGPAGSKFAMSGTSVNLVEMIVVIVGAGLTCIVMVTVIDYYRRREQMDDGERY